MQKRQSIKLDNIEWQNLEILAELTNSKASPGALGGECNFSWRTLLKRIAKGEIKLVENSTLKLDKNT